MYINKLCIDISSVLETECLNKRRFPDRCTLHREVTAWKKRRNDKKARINWRFTREKAKDKFKLLT
jgi:hypothetical protein